MKKLLVAVVFITALFAAQNANAQKLIIEQDSVLFIQDETCVSDDKYNCFSYNLFNKSSSKVIVYVHCTYLGSCKYSELRDLKNNTSSKSIIDFGGQTEVNISHNYEEVKDFYIKIIKI